MLLNLLHILIRWHDRRRAYCRECRQQRQTTSTTASNTAYHLTVRHR